MPALTADSKFQLLQPDRAAEFLFVNNDTANTVYISQERPVTALDIQVAPQASASLTGWWYVSTLDKATTVQCFVLPGGLTWSNPVGVQIALSNVGIPPFVPGLQSESLLLQGPSITPYYTFPKNARIWGGSITASMATNGSFSTGTPTPMYAKVRTGTQTVLAMTQLILAASAGDSNGGSDRTFPGLAAAAGDTLVLDVNNNVTPTNADISASCTVLFSVP